MYSEVKWEISRALPEAEDGGITARIVSVQLLAELLCLATGNRWAWGTHFAVAADIGYPVRHCFQSGRRIILRVLPR